MSDQKHHQSKVDYVYRKKSSPEDCVICMDHIEIHAVGECGHNQCCWKCVLTFRLKQGKKECAICKNINYKVLLTRSSSHTISNCADIIYDLDTELYFSDQFVKAEVLKKIQYYCRICLLTQEVKHKYQNLKQLQDHYKFKHQRYFCDLCVEHKPVLLFQQELYDYSQIGFHFSQHHPTCYFCHHFQFYDQDLLNKHYLNMHYFCDICKKQGKKKIQNSKRTNLPEYEVFKNIEEVRNHWKKHHFVCDKAKQECLALVFESAAQKASHYQLVHKETLPVQVCFIHSDTEEEEDFKEEEKKEQVQNLNRENFRVNFPTLGQSDAKKKMNDRGTIELGSFPLMPSQKIIGGGKSNRQTKQTNSVENEDLTLEYNEAQDNGRNLIVIEKQKYNKTNENGHGNKKKKKIIECNSKPQEEVKIQQQEFPSLGGNMLTIKTQNNNAESQWNKVLSQDRKKQITEEDKNQLQKQSLINKQEFPTLLEDNKAKKNNLAQQTQSQHQQPDIQIKKKRKKNKNKGQEVVDWSKLEKVDYNKNLGHLFFAK